MGICQGLSSLHPLGLWSFHRTVPFHWVLLLVLYFERGKRYRGFLLSLFYNNGSEIHKSRKQNAILRALNYIHLDHAFRDHRNSLGQQTYWKNYEMELDWNLNYHSKRGEVMRRAHDFWISWYQFSVGLKSASNSPVKIWVFNFPSI